MMPLSADSPRHLIWLSRLRVALRWWWPLDAAFVGLRVVASVATWRALATPERFEEIGPVARLVIPSVGVLGSTFVTGLAGLAALVAFQTLCVPGAKTGKRVATIFTWVVLAITAFDAAADVAVLAGLVR
jgi:hypothetical protein